MARANRVRPLRAKRSSSREPVPAPADSRQKQRLATRQRIFATAVAEFERVGFAEAQIDRIVREAGVARGTFYFHFSTKEHVLLELQRRVQDEIVTRLAALGPLPDSPRDYLSLIHGLVLESGRAHRSLRREVGAIFVRQRMQIELASEPLIIHLVDYFSDAVDRGIVRRDVAPDQLAVHFFSMMFLSFMNGDGDDSEDFVRAAIDIFVRGITV